MNEKTECTTGRCAYGTDCTCEFYADWPQEKPPVTPRPPRHPGRFFTLGHHMGRRDTCRRLWQHLDAEGRGLATAIAAEGADAE